MAVTARFIDLQGKHQSRLLGLRRQLGCHSGGNLAVALGHTLNLVARASLYSKDFKAFKAE
jgi:ABC-type hemin transport system ATPase subunit